MKIIGYNGLNGSISFRKENYKDLTEQEYRMCQGLDSAACIIVDGEIIAAVEEERFNGEKYTCDFPINAIRYCLQEADLSINDIDYICHSVDYENYKELFFLSDKSRLLYEKVLNPNLQKELWKKYFPYFDIDRKFVAVDHHLAHAASAYYPSGFDSSLILIADGIGEIHSISLYNAKDSNIELIKNYNFYSSLGVLYSQITAHLGFWVNSDEYKVMGLAPYGDATRYQAIFDEIIDYKDDGSIYINKFKLNKSELDRQTGRAFRNWLSTNFFPPRHPNDPITQEHKDLSATLQRAIEKAIDHILVFWQKKYSSKNLCLAGGVALNCTCNGFIFRKNYFDNIFIQPAANDAGTAIGAAFVQNNKKGGKLVNATPVSMPYLGPKFDNDMCENAINKFHDRIIVTKFTTDLLIKEAAKWIADRKIIAWMQGRMEFGPRALGNRSILADPTDPEMRDRINKLVKKREGFRPFAPSVKLESAHNYFDMPKMHEFPHMLFTVPVRDKYRQILPAITHVDGSARVQTVNKEYAEQYWLLIDEFEKIKGIPIILNTSFNVKGQPMVCTPIEAIETLIDTNIDALFMGDYLITNKTDVCNAATLLS